MKFGRKTLDTVIPLLLLRKTLIDKAIRQTFRVKIGQLDILYSYLDYLNSLPSSTMSEIVK